VIPTGKVAIVAYDAGGGEIVSSWARRHMTNGVAVLGGPAIEIFNRKVPNIPTANLVEAVRECQWVLTGTGNHELEFQAIAESRKVGRYVVAFLDHWTAYKSRFTRGGEMLLPNEMWVGDQDALRLVRQFFPDVTSTYVSNPYWQDALDQFNKLDTGCEETTLLFVSTNIDDHYAKTSAVLSDHWLLEKIIDFFEKSTILPAVNYITVRTHPSESKEKYANFCYPGVDIRHDVGCDLIQSIARHELVVGHNSMGLVVGKLCGRRSVNFLFDNHHNEQIPSRYVDEIVYLHAS